MASAITAFAAAIGVTFFASDPEPGRRTSPATPWAAGDDLDPDPRYC